MATGDLLSAAVVYLGAAVVSVPIAKRIGLGSVLGYLIAGMAIGPWVLGLVGDEGQDVLHFAEFGVVMMLFLIGLELEPALLWRMRGPILGLGGAQVLVTALAITGLAVAVGLAWQMALAVGLALALSSTAIVLQTLQEKNLMRTDAGQNAFAVLLFQDVAVIPLLAAFPLLATLDRPAGVDAHAGGAASWVAHQPGWVQTLAVLAAVVVIVVGGRFLMRPALRFIARSRLREVFTAAALLLVIGVALLMQRVGLSPALGTFLAGVVLADSEYRHALESDIEPFKGLLLGLFFISVGASIDFGLIAARPELVLGIAAGLMVLKWLILMVLGRVSKIALDQNLMFSFALAQGGEFAFVLFSFATQQGVLSTEVTAPLIAAVAISMAATPLVLLLHQRFLRPRVGTRELPKRAADHVDEHNPVIIAGFGNFGSVVGRLLRANGIATTVFENDSDRVELLRSLGFRVFYGDAKREDLLRAAGADEARLMVIALDRHDDVLATARMVKEKFPNLTILARATGRVQAYELLEAGVEHVYRQTLDTSLELGVDALRMLGLRGVQAYRSAVTLRRRDEESLRELAAMRHDHPAYLNRARELIAQFEQILEAEGSSGPVPDHGWDIDSLRAEVHPRSKPGDEDPGRSSASRS